MPREAPIANVNWQYGDFNDDGAVDLSDLLALTRNFGKSVPAALSPTDLPLPDSSDRPRIGTAALKASEAGCTGNQPASAVPAGTLLPAQNDVVDICGNSWQNMTIGSSPDVFPCVVRGNKSGGSIRQNDRSGPVVFGDLNQGRFWHAEATVWFAAAEGDAEDRGICGMRMSVR